MATTEAATANAAVPETGDGKPSPTLDLPTPTVTHYQQVAAAFLSALDQMSQVIPRMEAIHVSTANLVHSRLNVPDKFLATVTTGVELVAELQAINKLDPIVARDTLQFLDAFRPVFDRVVAFEKDLKFTMDSRKAKLVAEALIVYDVAKGLARDPGSTTVASHVGNMERDLGRRGRTKTSVASRKNAANPGLGVPAPRQRSANDPGGCPACDHSEPRG